MEFLSNASLIYGNMGCRVLKRETKISKINTLKGKYCILWIDAVETREATKSTKIGLSKSIFSVKNHQFLLPLKVWI